jgi:hypothetical protein
MFVYKHENKGRKKKKEKRKIFPTSANTDSILFYAEDERCVYVRAKKMMMTMTRKKRDEETKK